MILIVTLLWAFQDSTQKPGALIALEQARKGMGAGRIDWTVTMANTGLPLNFVSRYAANGDWIFENRGDSEGWTRFDPQTGVGAGRYPHLYMRNGDGFWRTKETGERASLWKADAPESLSNVKAFQGVGVFPYSFSIEANKGLAVMWEERDGIIARWSQTSDGPIYTVTRRYRLGDKFERVVWTINAEKGWNAERVQHIAPNGRVSAEVVCELERFGDAWLPRRSEYYRGGRLVETVQIKTAEFSPKKGRKRFTASDIGMESGMVISPQDWRPQSRRLLWNGTAITSRKQFDADREAGKVSLSPRMKRRWRGEPYSSPYETEAMRLQREITNRLMVRQYVIRRQESIWLRYVKQFTERFKLNQEQSQSATSILKDCQERAKAYVDRNKVKFNRVLGHLESAEKEPDQDAVKKHTAALAALRKPIDAIFEGQLKPRLEKLPTRAQRAAAQLVEADKKKVDP